MKRAIKITSISLLLTFLVGILIVFGSILYTITFNRVEFSAQKIMENSLCVQVYNANNVLIKEENTASDKKLKLHMLPSYVKEAFISIEDKNFYKHNGINVKRMAKAFLNNLKTLKIKEGASTISQQLIKNTHLSSQKTFSRKINEILLAQELEKQFTKEEILDYYLNIIYFGDNCYGLESASSHYFSKPAHELTLSEACMFAGIIKAPHYYSPVSNPERCLERRNLVLKEMYKDNKISKSEFDEAKNQPISLNLNKNTPNKLNSYTENALQEASSILKLPVKQLALAGYKIYTYQDVEKQKALNIAFSNNKPDSDCASICLNAKTGAVEAFIGQSSYRILEQKRQPGSAIKPLLVYGPAINEDLISPATKILDEPINIEGYSPKNINGNFAGYISARESLSKSLNVPTVKIATYLGIDKMLSYAKSLNIPIDKKDNNYALALGGMTYGTDLASLVGAYTSLANAGKLSKPKFVNYITDANGKIVYRSGSTSKQVFRQDTAYLVTDMLKTSAKTGTAKKLNSINFDIASKTGTVGTKKGNTDAYNISYTSQEVLGTWMGNMDNTFINSVGAGKPTEIAKAYFENLYSHKSPAPFLKPSSVEEVEIDALELENNHKVVQANSFVPEKYKIKEIFSKFNLPKEKSENYLKVMPARLEGKIENGNVYLTFDAQNFLEYEVYKTQNGKDELLENFCNREGKIVVKCNLKDKERATFFVITKIQNYALKNGYISEKSNEITLIAEIEQNHKWYLGTIRLALNL